ncbi:MAG: LLM class flavin-dependent oxidoreductase [Planctomycetaceae bacterium]|nr:LLM class flavin-dependent oxidoreductase [Planctomycetaceae bacterium]MBP60730.1 LLM class flavin-dependent oxidoreductase [Planctomycetaceae bacterium]
MIKLSVLDQSPIRSGGSHADAIAETLKLAQAVDRLGYSRYWVAEHHNSLGLACTVPEILISRIASMTKQLRVGAGGIMLSHYSPLKVAETFRMLETLFPGRIDLGVGRAPGTDRRTSAALRPGSDGWGAEQFPGQVEDLIGFVSDRTAANHPFASVRAVPIGPGIPPIWLLGSGDQSGALAAHFGCGFSFAHFINNHGGTDVMRAYRDDFQPSDEMQQPQGTLAVFALCAETDDEAERLCTSRDLWRLRLDQGIMGPFPSVEEATSYPYTAEELARIALNQQRQVVGSPDRVKAQLLELCQAYDVNELLVLTICFDFESRRRSYELLADAFRLSDGV